MFQNLKEVKVLFRQIHRKEGKLMNDLEASHDRFYKNVRGQKRELMEKQEEFAIMEYQGGAVMARKIRNRQKTSERHHEMRGTLKEDAMEKALSQDPIELMTKKPSAVS